MNRVEVLSQQVEGGFQTTNDGAVAVIIVNNAPLNALNHANRLHLVASIKIANETASVKVIVITGAGKAFSAGADITEFSAAGMKEPYLPDVFDVIESSKKLVVAAVNGMALGGGCELALASHLRVSMASANFSLPEIKLGIIPGAGGTQRLPRAVGVQNAIMMACSGRNVKAPAAKSMGLVDAIVPAAEEAAGVVAFASKIGLAAVAAKAPIRRLCNDRSKLGNFLTNSFVFRAAKGQLQKTVPSGMTSPYRCLEAIQAATSVSNFKDGLAVERKIFLECAQTPQAAAMQHFFFSQRAALRIPGIPKDAKGRDVRTLGVIGGGTMGAGIAICALNANIPTTILETSDERKAAALKTIEDVYGSRLKKGKITPQLAAERLKLLSVVVNDYSAFQDVDFVIEAVFENMALKKSIFANLDKVCKRTCVLATNTSTLSVDVIASATTRPEMVIGAHFFSPAHMMPLLEFIRGAKTSPEVILTSLELGKRIKKVPVVVGNCFGFVANRMIIRAGFQAMCLAEEGCFPREVDAVVKKFGFPVGPFVMQDIAGLDIGSKIRLETPPELIPKRDVTTVSEALVKEGRLGQKTLKGWYKYNPKDPRTPIPDFAVEKKIVQVSAEKKITRRMITNKEIEERYLYTLINEAAAILSEGFALRPSDIDVIYIFGFGFPPYKGGPCHYADHIGIDKVVQALEVYHTALGGDTFPAPCALLKKMVAEKKTFADLNKACAF
jgi:3-hydroxyacyl-CoA dehydrogenase